MIEFYTREIQNGRENRPILNRFKEKRQLSQQVYYRMYNSCSNRCLSQC